MIRKLLIGLTISSALASQVACSDFGNPFDPASMREVPLKKPEPPPPPPPSENVQGAALLEDYQRPSYPNGVRRNPFQPDPGFLIQQATFDMKNDRVKEPLEAFGIGQLKLSAIVSGLAIPKAMFIDPTGLGHFVKVGDRIGQGGYVVTAIRESSVTIASDENSEDDSNSDKNVMTQVIRLSDQLSADENKLSEEDQAALDRILNTPEGREAVRQNIDTNNPSNSNPTGTDGGQ